MVKLKVFRGTAYSLENDFNEWVKGRNIIIISIKALYTEMHELFVFYVEKEGKLGKEINSRFKEKIMTKGGNVEW